MSEQNEQISIARPVLVENLVKNFRSVDNALFESSYLKNTSLARLALTAGANIEARDRWEQTPLIVAAQKNRTEIVHVLLQAGANTEAQDREGLTAAYWARENDNENLLRLLSSPEVTVSKSDLAAVFGDLSAFKSAGGGADVVGPKKTLQAPLYARRAALAC